MAVTTHDANRERHWICARRLSERRHTLGLTQNDVVERLSAQGATATNRTLSAMEHGQGVDVGRLPDLAIALDCTVTYLLGLTDEPCSWTPEDARLPRRDASTRDPVPTERTDTFVDAAHVSWILGPDIPERRGPGSSTGPARDQSHA